MEMWSLQVVGLGVLGLEVAPPSVTLCPPARSPQILTLGHQELPGGRKPTRVIDSANAALPRPRVFGEGAWPAARSPVTGAWRRRAAAAAAQGSLCALKSGFFTPDC